MRPPVPQLSPRAQSGTMSPLCVSASRVRRAGWGVCSGDLQPSACPDPTGRAGAATLQGGELPDVPHQFDRIRPSVERDHSGVPQRGATSGQCVRRQRDVQVVFGEESSERTADLQDDRAAAPEPSAEFVDDAPYRGADPYLERAGTSEPFGEAHRLGPGFLRCAVPGVARTTVSHDPRHRRQRLHVVAHGGCPHQSAVGGIRGPGTGAPSGAFEAGDERGLLARDVRARSFDDLDGRPRVPRVLGVGEVAVCYRACGSTPRGTPSAPARCHGGHRRRSRRAPALRAPGRGLPP